MPKPEPLCVKCREAWRKIYLASDLMPCESGLICPACAPDPEDYEWFPIPLEELCA
jgi:hypothetical protein